MTAQTVAGMKISIIAGNPATYDSTGYDTLFTSGSKLIGEIVDPGEFGPEYSITSHVPIDTRVAKKFKGTRDDGTMTLQLAMDRADEGQELLETALASDSAYSFKVLFSHGTIAYFQALVTSFRVATGNADAVVSASVTLAITASKTGVGVVWKDAA